MDYLLSRLGDREFEHVSQALALAVLGTHVEIFGDGPDGGREATFNGPTSYIGKQSSEPWSGYGVVQAKFRRRPNSDSDSAWLANEIRKELKKWADFRSKRVKQGRIPSYIIFTTDVYPSSIPGTGGIDTADSVIAEYASQLGLKGWDVWHGDKISRLLDRHEAIRTTYAAFITPGDVLARVMQLLPSVDEVTVESLASFTAKEVMSDQWIRLSQAGGQSNDKLTLTQIGSDLPCSQRDDSGSYIDGVLSHIVHSADRVLRPSMLAQGSRPHFAMIAGPGQGKTTLGQMLAQIYRCELLRERPRFSLAGSADIVETYLDHLEVQEISLPRVRRWPIRVPLGEFGDAIAGNSEDTLLRFIAARISARCPGNMTSSRLHTWLKAWPWIIILDGLDEIASTKIRSLTEQKINDFLVDAAEVDADLMVVATTRPQGYLDEFNPQTFGTLSLRYLTRDEVISYAELLSSVRNDDDPGMQEQLAESVRVASDDRLTSRLMRTPLQITIMSLLLESRARAPSSRFQLFDAYFGTIYLRETGKPGPTARFLEAHRPSVEAVHEEVAFRLQKRAEDAGEAESWLEEGELRTIAVGRLEAEGFEGPEVDRLASKMVNAAKQRLVLLVPGGDGGEVGFEVRSLQEYLAARALTSGDVADGTAIESLITVAQSAHWRNTWLLAVGRIFRERDRLRPQLISALDSIDMASSISATTVPSAGLALEILEDDIPAQAPMFLRILTRKAVRIFDKPPSSEIGRLARALLPLANSDAQCAQIISMAIDQGLSTSDIRKFSTVVFCGYWADQRGPRAAEARRQMTNCVRPMSSEYKAVLATLALDYECLQLRRMAGQRREQIPDRASEKDEIARKVKMLAEIDEGGEHWSDVAEFMRSETGQGFLSGASFRKSSENERAAEFLTNIEVQLYRLALALDPLHWRLSALVTGGIEQRLAQVPVAHALGPMSAPHQN